MKLFSIRFFTSHFVPLVPYRTKMMLNKFVYLCQINFVIFVQKRLVHAQNLTQICWVKFPSPLKKFFTFIPNFLSDKVDRERLFSEFQSTLVKVILKPNVSFVILYGIMHFLQNETITLRRFLILYHLLFTLSGADPGLILGCCKILRKKLKIEMT